MGLHRDPATYSTSPIECQVRRLIWHQICFLDLRTCEATGPRPQIRPDDFDTRFPLNVDDTDLDRAELGDKTVTVDEDKPYFTDMTITRMRFECYKMHRVLWIERPKLEKKREEGEKKVTITSLLARIQSFRAAMEKAYLPMLSKATPLHALASQIYGILSNRLYIHILQKYLSSDKHKMPDRLRQIVLSAAIMILEHSMNIEQQPALSTWSWYVGALHQYHSALLVISEMYAASRTPAMEQRAWRCLDFVFELPPDMSNIEKTRIVLEDLINRTQIYASLKKWRAPKDMPQAGARIHTPGYQLRQAEAEERQRIVNPQSSGGSAQALFNTGNPIGEHMSPPLQQPYQPPRISHSRSQSSLTFPGAIPNTDWGTFDIPASTSTSAFQQPSASPELYPMHNYPSTTPSNNMIPPRLTSQRSDPTSSSFVAPLGTAGSSPMDALNEIDWASSYPTSETVM
jgi:hypothetical protein